MADVASFVEVAKTGELPAGNMRAVKANGKDVVIVNYEGRYYAIGRYCTHQGGDLSLGKLEGNVVTCPRHGSRFDVTTGVAIQGPKLGPFRLKTGNERTYEVRVEGNSIRIGV